MTRVFLDANVLFSAAWRAGSGLARLWEMRSPHLVTSDRAAGVAARALDPLPGPDHLSPMRGPTKPRATYEDLAAVPASRIAEIIDGVLVTQPRPASPHARAASVLGIEIGGPFDRGRGGPGGWVLLDEPELHLTGGHVLVPDLAGWRRERMPRVPRVAAFELAPDWVCEVLSPSTAAIDRADKMPIYAAERVAHVWLVDPILRTLEVHRLDGATYRVVHVHRDATDVRAEPFDAVAFELGALWTSEADEAR